MQRNAGALSRAGSRRSCNGVHSRHGPPIVTLRGIGCKGYSLLPAKPELSVPDKGGWVTDWTGKDRALLPTTFRRRGRGATESSGMTRPPEPVTALASSPRPRLTASKGNQPRSQYSLRLIRPLGEKSTKGRLCIFKPRRRPGLSLGEEYGEVAPQLDWNLILAQLVKGSGGLQDVFVAQL